MGRVPREQLQHFKGKDWTYKAVAESMNIEPEKFEEFMEQRFDTGKRKEGCDYHLNYTLEWAARIVDGNAEIAADKETTTALENAGLA